VSVIVASASTAQATLSAGGIAGIVISIVGVIAALLVVYHCCCYGATNNKTTKEPKVEAGKQEETVSPIAVELAERVPPENKV
jgi:hypothetical protein